MIGLAPSLAQEDTTLAPIVVESDADAQKAGVSSRGPVKTDRYVGKSATVGTKTDVELAKVPQSVSTVSRRELEDRNVQSLVQATNYSSGVRTGVFGFDPRFDTVFIRGFNVTDSGYYRDGLRDLGGASRLRARSPTGLRASPS